MTRIFGRPEPPRRREGFIPSPPDHALAHSHAATEVHVAVRAHVRLELFPEAFVVDRKLLDERAVASLGFFDDGATERGRDASPPLIYNVLAATFARVAPTWLGESAITCPRKARHAVLPAHRPDRARDHAVPHRAKVNRARRASHGVSGDHVRHVARGVSRGGSVRAGRRHISPVA